MSIGMIVLASVCVLQLISDPSNSERKKRLQRFIKTPSYWMLSGIYVMVALGMLWTENIGHGQWDLRMKLPILTMPIILALLNPLNQHNIRILKGLFILSLTFSLCYCLLVYAGLIYHELKDIRDISVFISHIRFSLLLVVGLLIAFHETWSRGLLGKAFCITLSLGFIYFLFIIESLTGIAALALVAVCRLIQKFLISKNKKTKWIIASTMVILPIVTAGYLYSCYTSYFRVAHIDWNNLPVKTMHGDSYDHNKQYPLVENGHYTYTYLAWGELYGGWRERSTMSLDNLDKKGGSLKGTLIRYLASKDLHKDLDGIRQLSQEDVVNIENGETSFGLSNLNPIRKRIDRVFFEYSNFRAGGSANGHSVFQRLEFWRAAWGIIQDNFWYGVGTGDTKTAFALEYDKMQSTLDADHRLRAHNQYLTMWLTYGLFGFLYFALAIIIGLRKGGWKHTLYAPFVLLTLLSFCSEDTLESQAGVMFFIFFSIFLHPAFEKNASLKNSVHNVKR